jgi:hypothetical protein
MITGTNLAGATPTDRMWYMSYWGFYEQKRNISVVFDWGGEPALECIPQYWTDTFIRCMLLKPMAGAKNLPVRANVLGKGLARSTSGGDLTFSYGLYIDEVRSRGRADGNASGSIYGGDIVTLKLSGTLMNYHPYADKVRAAAQTPDTYLMDQGGPLQLYVFFHKRPGTDFDTKAMA